MWISEFLFGLGRDGEEEIARAELEEVMLRAWTGETFEPGGAMPSGPQRSHDEAPSVRQPPLPRAAQPQFSRQQLLELQQRQLGERERQELHLREERHQAAIRQLQQERLLRQRQLEEFEEQAYNSMQVAMLLSLFPREPWTYSHIRDGTDGEGDKECRVCLEEYEPEKRCEEVIRLPCMHYAHATCMESWLVRSPTCPVCRTNVREFLATLEEPGP